jgi:hypothetical protein
MALLGRHDRTPPSFRTIQICPKDFAAGQRDTPGYGISSQNGSSRREREHGSSSGLFESKKRRALVLLRRGGAHGGLHARCRRLNQIHEATSDDNVEMTERRLGILRRHAFWLAA